MIGQDQSLWQFLDENYKFLKKQTELNLLTIQQFIRICKIKIQFLSIVFGYEEKNKILSKLVNLDQQKIKKNQITRKIYYDSQKKINTYNELDVIQSKLSHRSSIFESQIEERWRDRQQSGQLKIKVGKSRIRQVKLEKEFSNLIDQKQYDQVKCDFNVRIGQQIKNINTKQVKAYIKKQDNQKF